MRIRFILFMLMMLVAVVSVAKEPHVQLNEVEVRPSKERYSKRNNPAVDLLRMIIKNSEANDPRLNHDFYSHGSYERISVGAIGVADNKESFLREFVDTTELSHRPMLNLSVKEKVSDFYFRRNPDRKREVVRLRNRNGFDELMGDADALQSIFDDMLRPVNLYSGSDITLLRQKFVNPLSGLADDFYKFYLTDTIACEQTGDSLVVLSFLPHNPETPGFNGKIYVVKGDSTQFVRRVELRLPHHIL